MKIYKCDFCESNSTESGRCINCGKPLGKINIAIYSAMISTIILGVVWVGFAWITGIQLPIIAIVFGGAVSYAVTYYSGGTGIIYQAIATTYTLLGLIISDTIVVIIQWHEFNPDWGVGNSLPPFIEIIRYQTLYDPFTTFFFLLGVVGGLYIWR